MPLQAANCNPLYEQLLRLHSEKGGDIAIQSWPIHGTVWRHDAVLSVFARERNAILRLMTGPIGLQHVSKPCGAGYTPLHLAAFLGVPSLVSSLLEAGAAAEAKSHSGRTPFDEAIYSGNIEAALVLLKALPSPSKEEATAKMVEYASLPGAALIPAQVHTALGGKIVQRRAPRIDPRPVESVGGACSVGGGWAESTMPQPKDDVGDIDQVVTLCSSAHKLPYLHRLPCLHRLPSASQCATCNRLANTLKPVCA